MNSLGELSDATVEAIAEYIRTFSAPPPRPDYSDLWYDPAQPGWGLSITHHAGSDKLFAVLYLHEPPNRAFWLVMPGGIWTGIATYNGALYRSLGSRPDRPHVPASASARLVGHLTLTFTDLGVAQLEYVIDGERHVRQVVRQPF